MKLKLCIGVVLFAMATAWAQTNNLTTLLQQGLFEEQANRNLDAAIENYAVLARQFDKDRQLAATAVFRLGECYRAQGKTNEAAVQYQRILRDFADQQTLVTLSRQNLAGMGIGQPTSLGVTANGAPEAAYEILRLSSQITAIEELKGDPEKQARTVQAMFPDEDLKRMLLHLPKLQAQETMFKGKLPEKIDGIVIAVPPSGRVDLLATGFPRSQDSFGLKEAKAELQKQLQFISERVNFILGLQKERLQFLQSLASDGASGGASQAHMTGVMDEEDQEIARIKRIIQNSPDLINALSNGQTPLAKAAANGWFKTATYLMDHGADVNRSLALNAAAESGNRAMVELLLSRGANVNAIGNDHGRTALQSAVAKGFQAVVEVLLAHKADVNTQDTMGNPPLFYAAGQIKIAQSLLAAGADSNSEDQYGKTTLSEAVLNHSTEVVKLLLAAKADPNAGKLDVPLLAAIRVKDTATAELLLQAGANPNAEGAVRQDVYFKGGTHFASDHPTVTPLFLAISMNQPSMVQLLLKFKADPNDAQTDGRPILFSALSRPEILIALLDAGAKAEVRDETDANNNLGFIPVAGRINGLANSDLKRTPLLLVAGGESNVVAVAALLQHGANPNATDGRGETPLIWAAYNLADEKVFALLLEHKADPNVRNREGKTPLDLVKERLQIQVSGSRFPNQNPNGVNYGIVSSEQKTQVEKLIALLHQHGALDSLPDWDRIRVSRASANFCAMVFMRDTNHWNQYSLLELIFKMYPNGTGSMFINDAMAFPDLTRIVVVRPATNGAAAKRIEVNLLNATNAVDCSRDVGLEFGDVVEIPEREHSLAEKKGFLAGNQEWDILNYFRSRAGVVSLILGNVPAKSVPLQPGFQDIGDVLRYTDVRAALTSSSDLSRVKVTRRDPKKHQPQELTLDCRRTLENYATFNLWLRAGDVIEVPLKK